MGLLDGLSGMLGGKKKKKKQKSLISTGNPLIDALLPMLLGGGGAGILGKLGGLGALGKGAGGKGGRGASSGGLGGLGGLLAGGGLGGLLSQLQSAGLGGKAQSWVSTGANEAISPEEVEQGLGADAIDHLARQTGMDRGAVTSQLATVLPNLVNDLTPDGSVPDQDALAGLASKIDLGRILGG